MISVQTYRRVNASPRNQDGPAMTDQTDSSSIDTISALSFWQSAIDIAPLAGGITNRNFIVSGEQGRFVVRLGDDIPVHQILRFNEVAAGTAAHIAGLSPAIRHHQPGVLVMDYIDSRALTAEQVREPQQLGRIIELMQRCHREIPRHLRGASVVFWVFHVLRDYAATLRDGDSRYCDRLPTLLATAEQLEKAAGPFDIVFGHNDLLPANILDDGDRLWLIDWEYAGFNSPLFDLGGLASNNELSEAQERWMLEQYFDSAINDTRWRQYQAMKCASLLRETMWSMVSEIHSALDFDYSVYTAENLGRYEQCLNQFNAL
jgi:thiamine kinase-like enzyme